MSLILDALRKSEAERRRGQAPGLHAPVAPMPPPRASAWRHAPILAGGALVLVAVALLFRPGAATRDAVPPVPASATPQAGDAGQAAAGEAGAPTNAPPEARAPRVAGGMAPAAEPSLAQPPPAPREAAARDTTPPPGAASPHPPTATRAADPAVAAGPMAPAPAAAAPPSPPPPVADTPADPPLPTLAILAPGERAALPPLKLSMHVWNDAPAQRFAIVDGQRVTEGASVGGAVVAEIRRDGVVLDVNGRRLLLPRP